MFSSCSKRNRSVRGESTRKGFSVQVPSTCVSAVWTGWLCDSGLTDRSVGSSCRGKCLTSPALQTLHLPGRLAVGWERIRSEWEAWLMLLLAGNATHFSTVLRSPRRRRHWRGVDSRRLTVDVLARVQSGEWCGANGLAEGRFKWCWPRSEWVRPGKPWRNRWFFCLCVVRLLSLSSWTAQVLALSPLPGSLPDFSSWAESFISAHNDSHWDDWDGPAPRLQSWPLLTIGSSAH